MTMLEELLAKNQSKSTLDSLLKSICDQIMEEESPKFESFEGDRPKGPNIFLAIELSGKPATGSYDFLCIEREFKDTYIISIISCPPIRRKRVWEVKDNEVPKILQFFAEVLKYIKGE